MKGMTRQQLSPLGARYGYSGRENKAISPLIFDQYQGLFLRAQLKTSLRGQVGGRPLRQIPGGSGRPRGAFRTPVCSDYDVQCKEEILGITARPESECEEGFPSLRGLLAWSVAYGSRVDPSNPSPYGLSTARMRPEDLVWGVVHGGDMDRDYFLLFKYRQSEAGQRFPSP